MCNLFVCVYYMKGKHRDLFSVDSDEKLPKKSTEEERIKQIPSHTKATIFQCFFLV